MKTNYFKDFYWANDASLQFLSQDYLEPNETLEQRVKQISDNAEKILGIKGFSDKFYGYMAKGYYSLSTPVWKNFGKSNGSPISCFGIDIQDDTSDILRSVGEIGMMTKVGGGTAGYFGKLRPRGASISGGAKSNGSVSFMPLFQQVTNTISQTNRRGFFAAYHDIEHDDFDEFMQCRNEGNEIQTIALALCVSDEFMRKVEQGDKEARRRWLKVIQKRDESGFPYLYFTDTANRNKPQVYKDKNMTLTHSQMCNEIYEYTDKNVSFVCALSSYNLLHWDELKETDAIETLAYFMDAVYSEFITKAESIPFMEKAVRFAKNHRSIGLGVLGWHSYLQRNMIPFEDLAANFKTTEIFKEIDKRTLNASKELATMFGEPTILKGYGERFTTRLAIAPTTSSSFILGQISPSIEPLLNNCFLKDLAKGKFFWKNPFLVDLLEEKGINNDDVWDKIMKADGSVQGLDELNDAEKAVFKTFSEINQMSVIRQASIRQKFIDQGQSINIMLHPETSAKDNNAILFEAWRLGLKGLYYQRSANVAQKVSRDLASCSSCES